MLKFTSLHWCNLMWYIISDCNIIFLKWEFYCGSCECMVMMWWAQWQLNSISETIWWCRDRQMMIVRRRPCHYDCKVEIATFASPVISDYAKTGHHAALPARQSGSWTPQFPWCHAMLCVVSLAPSVDKHFLCRSCLATALFDVPRMLVRSIFQILFYICADFVEVCISSYKTKKKNCWKFNWEININYNRMKKRLVSLGESKLIQQT